ncbi:MAG: methyltransferase domain-containing protein [Anaerolineae bacterium]
MSREQALGRRVPICDYEGSRWETEFWPGREYEHLAERIALRKLLPARGERLVEIGAGFGRLADLYGGYRQVVFLDYAKTMLRQAQSRLGRDARFIYVAADLYNLPLADAACDTAVTVRVLHHLRDIPTAFRQIQRVLTPGGTYILEFANKRNLKAILRYLFGRQTENPFSPEPYEFVELNIQFSPDYMARCLQEAGFSLQRQLAVSHFRVPLLKRLIKPRLLASLDGLLQGLGAIPRLSPSLFVKAQVGREGGAQRVSQALFRCPACRSQELEEEATTLHCLRCGALWPIDDGIYDFKGE